MASRVTVQVKYPRGRRRGETLGPPWPSPVCAPCPPLPAIPALHPGASFPRILRWHVTARRSQPGDTTPTPPYPPQRMHPPLLHLPTHSREPPSQPLLPPLTKLSSSRSRLSPHPPILTALRASTHTQSVFSRWEPKGSLKKVTPVFQIL